MHMLCGAEVDNEAAFVAQREREREERTVAGSAMSVVAVFQINAACIAQAGRRRGPCNH